MIMLKAERKKIKRQNVSCWTKSAKEVKLQIKL